MIKRISRSLSNVAKEVRDELKNEHGIDDTQLAKLRNRVINSGFRFPYGGIKAPISVLWIDYEVQRDVIISSILNLLKRWDCRICQPAACNTVPSLVDLIDEVNHVYRFKKLFIYDAQHRAVTMAILGFEEIYVTVVVDDDPTFASWAFRESNSTIKKIGTPDKHRNNLRLYSLGRHDDETIRAYNLQSQFDRLKIDLVEKPEKIPANERQSYYMSHFDYALKPMGEDSSGRTAGKILEAIITAWPRQEKIQNGVYVGLYKMNSMTKSLPTKLPKDWMTQVCRAVAISFKNPSDLESAAEKEIKQRSGGTWSVPDGMYKFMREVYKLNGGTLPIPSDGKDLNLHNGVWMQGPNLIPNHKNLYRKPVEVEEQQHEIA